MAAAPFNRLRPRRPGLRWYFPRRPTARSAPLRYRPPGYGALSSTTHPAFARKSLNADAEYFTLLHRIINAPDSARNAVFAEWIAALGSVSMRSNSSVKCEVFNDFAWIYDTLQLGAPLSRMLAEIRQADPGKNRYVEQTSVNVSYIEPEYTDIPDEDIAYRLLGVAKFWNAVDSYSPNRNLTDRPWDEVLRDYTAMAFDSSVDFMALYSRMVSELCDSHVNSWFIPLFGGRFVPVVCRFAGERLFVTDTCTRRGRDSPYRRQKPGRTFGGTRALHVLLQPCCAHARRLLCIAAHGEGGGAARVSEPRGAPHVDPLHGRWRAFCRTDIRESVFAPKADVRRGGRRHRLHPYRLAYVRR